VDRIRDLRHYLNTDTTRARAHLAKHIERIVMQPGERAYVASGSWNLVGAQMEDVEGARYAPYRLTCLNSPSRSRSCFSERPKPEPPLGNLDTYGTCNLRKTKRPNLAPTSSRDSARLAELQHPTMAVHTFSDIGCTPQCIAPCAVLLVTRLGQCRRLEGLCTPLDKQS
jgi:hypothetical protein